MKEVRSASELSAYYTSIYERNNKQWFDFEAIIQSVYEALLLPGDTAIDGGAHMGVHTIPMAKKVQPRGTVFAFEPIHEIVTAFRRRLDTECPELKTNIRLYEMAISDHSGIEQFLVADDPGYSGLRERLYPREMPLDCRKVLVDTIDHVCAAASNVRFLKLDLEGGEFHALRGARALLERERPTIVFEYDRFNSPRYYAYEHEDFMKFFDGLGYRLLDVIGTPFETPSVWDSAKLWYYFAFPREGSLLEPIQAAIRQNISAQVPGWTF